MYYHRRHTETIPQMTKLYKLERIPQYYDIEQT
jgi:hypothetical protein